LRRSASMAISSAIKPGIIPDRPAWRVALHVEIRGNCPGISGVRTCRLHGEKQNVEQSARGVRWDGRTASGAEVLIEKRLAAFASRSDRENGVPKRVFVACLLPGIGGYSCPHQQSQRQRRLDAIAIQERTEARIAHPGQSRIASAPRPRRVTARDLHPFGEP
jgi:hypothetical protein